MTTEQIIAHLKVILNVNGIKVGSKKAQDMEYAYLHGIVITYEHNNMTLPPIVGVCLTSGRSILTLGQPKLQTA